MKTEQIKRMVGIAFLMAIVAVLQLLGSSITIGTFSVSLVLIPIVIGAAVYGPLAGAILGGVFGLIVTIGCINGTDVGGAMVFAANPFLCILLVMGKGIAAGAAAGWVYSLLEKKNQYLAVVVAAIVCPVTNTGVFIIGMLLLFKDVLAAWAGGSDLANYIIFGLVGANFLFETVFNLVCVPVIMAILNALKKRR